MIGVLLQVGGIDVLSLAVGFLVLAVLAAIVGARWVAGVSLEVARILVLVVLILVVFALVR